MEQVQRFGEYEIDHKLFELRRHGRVIPVERRVFDLIAYLLANRDRVVSKEELLRHVWHGRAVSPASLTVAMTAARRALQEDSANARLIITHRGRGYRFRLDSQSAQTQAATVGSSPECPGPFVGREGELRALRALLEIARGDRLQLALVVGEPGIGKTRLLDEFVSECRQNGSLAFVGRCREEEGAPPFWPWIQIARSACSDERLPLAARLLAREAPGIANLIPDLRAQAYDGRDDRLPPANARFRLFSGFAAFLRGICGQGGLVLVIDDIHRGDESSISLLDFLFDDLRDARALVVAALRPQDSRLSEQSELLAALTRRVATTTLQIGGLSAAEVATLVHVSSGWSPSTEQARALQDLTGGNPFFIGQIAPRLKRDGVKPRELLGELPPTVRDAIARQLDDLRPPTARAMDAASVLGRDFDAPTLAGTLRVSLRDVLGMLEEAVEVGIIRRITEQPEGFRFAHALVREVLYQRLDLETRARVHGAAAESLERDAGIRETRLAEVAHHLVESAVLGGEARAVEACCEVAERASKALAYEEAVRFYREALHVLELNAPGDRERICSVLVRLGTELIRAGQRAEAKRVYDRAAKTAELLGAPEVLAEAALGLAPGFFAVEAGVRDELLISLLRRALALIKSKRHPLRVTLMARLGMALFWSDGGSESAELSRSAWEVARDSENLGLKLYVVIARWLAEWTPYEFVARRRLAEQAEALARAVGDREVLAVALLYQLTGHLEAGEIASFDRMLREFRGLAEDLRQPQAQWYARLLAATRDLHAGRFVQAEEAAREYFEIGQRIGDANALHSKMAQNLLLASERGDANAIVVTSEEGIRLYPIFVGWRASRCWGLARVGRTEEAHRALDDILALDLKVLPRRLDWPTALAVLAEASFLLRRPDAAEQLFELLLPMDRQILVLGFCVMTWGPVARYLGLLSETMGRLREAGERFEQARCEAAGSDGAPWVAHADLGLYRIRAKEGCGARELGRLAENVRSQARRLGMSHLERSAAGLVST